MKPSDEGSSFKTTELKLRNLRIDLCNLIVEARTPGVSENGYGEGVHCPPLSGLNNHSCSEKSPECQRHQDLIQRILLAHKSFAPLEVEVLLLPECCKGDHDYKLLDRVSSKDYLLLERWKMHFCSPCFTRPVVDIAGLLRAVRSFLHFSQLSAWLSLHKGQSSLNIHYWIRVPGEGFGPKFNCKPDVHKFPVSNIANNISGTLSVTYRPRTLYIPIIPCSKHSDLNQNRVDGFVTSEASSSQIFPLKMCKANQLHSVLVKNNTLNSTVSCTVGATHPIVLNRTSLKSVTIKNSLRGPSYLKTTLKQSITKPLNKYAHILGYCKEKYMESPLLIPKKCEQCKQLVTESSLKLCNSDENILTHSTGEQENIVKRKLHLDLKKSQKTSCKLRKITGDIMCLNNTLTAANTLQSENNNKNSVQTKSESKINISQLKEQTTNISSCTTEEVHISKLCIQQGNKTSNTNCTKPVPANQREECNLKIESDCLHLKKRKLSKTDESSTDNKQASSQYICKRKNQNDILGELVTVETQSNLLGKDVFAEKSNSKRNNDHAEDVAEQQNTSFKHGNNMKFRVLRDVKNTTAKIHCEIISQNVEKILTVNTSSTRCEAINISAVTSKKTGALPLPSSPTPIRRCMKSFNYVTSQNSALSNKRILFQEGNEKLNILKNCEQSKFNKGKKLLGNFEESVLNGCLQPVNIVEGFTAEIGASGSFCPDHITLPATVYFYELNNLDRGASPYLGHIGLNQHEYHVPKKGAVQVTLFNPHGTVVKMFVVSYDLSDMPPMCHTFVRQRTFYMPTSATEADPACQKWLRYLIHLRFASSRTGKIFLHREVKIVILNKCDVDAASIHSQWQYELRSFIQMPTNPRFSLQS